MQKSEKFHALVLDKYLKNHILGPFPTAFDPKNSIKDFSSKKLLSKL